MSPPPFLPERHDGVAISSFPFGGLLERGLPMRDFLVLGHVFAAHAACAESNPTSTVIRSSEDALLNRT